MGFKIPERTARIAFEPDDDYYGAEVRVRLGLPLEFVFRMQRLSDADSDSVAIMREFAEKVLIDWNLEDESGKAIPATADAFIAQDYAFCAAIMRGWNEHAAGVPGPLGEQSRNGSGDDSSMSSWPEPSARNR